MTRPLARAASLLARAAFSSAAAGSEKPPARRLSTVFKLLLAAPAVAAGAWILNSDNPSLRASLALQIPVRLVRDVAAASSTMLDYRWSLYGLEEGEARQQALRRCHARGADRLQRLCFTNGGIYIKMGQHIAQLDHLLPQEYVAVMRRSMLDKCPVSPAHEVARTIREDLGKGPEELFALFEDQPFASASLAQVHRARSHDGQELAVKVQHRGLRDTCAADTATVEFLVNLVHLFFPSFNYFWLVDEIKGNLPKELDFVHEAGNAERCRVNLESRRSRVRGRVHVPAVYHAATSPRVLTMEYVHGAAICNQDALRELGCAPRAVARLVAETFAEMIFVHGDVHCDPHAANMLVRRGRCGGPELVLLDHGLYRQYDDAFRLEYAAFWRALVQGDEAGIKAHAGALGAGEAYPMFASMLTMRPWGEIKGSSIAQRLAIPNTAEARNRIQGYAARFAGQISDLLWRIPRPMLLLLKTNDCLRAVDLCLGQPVNTFIITARECTRVLSRQRMAEHPGVATWWAGMRDALGIELRVGLVSAMSWWASAKLYLSTLFMSQARP